MADAPVNSGDPLQPNGSERPGEVSGPVSVVLADDQALMRMRSEERRVGKECAI